VKGVPTLPDDRMIGKRLQAVRRRRGLSQVELAHALGLTQPRVSQYERGEVRLSATLAAGFAKVLKASADEILALDQGHDDPILKDRLLLRRIEKIARLPRRDRQALLKNLDMFLKGAGVQ
jgi:transcriptional regulator with XRE-family HTH domain